MQLIRDIAAFARENGLSLTPPSEPRCCELHRSLVLAYNKVMDLRFAAHVDQDEQSPLHQEKALAFFGEPLVERMQEICNAAETLECEDCDIAVMGTSRRDPALHELIVEIGGEQLAIRLRRQAGIPEPEDDRREEELEAKAELLREAIKKGGTPQDN